MPASKELLVHVLFDFLGHFLLIGSIFEGMADNMLGLKLKLRFHFGVGNLDSPLLCSLLQ